MAEPAGARGPAVDALVDDLFRRASGELVAGLVRALGSRHLELAEDVVQEALVAALRRWPFHGVPRDPVAWLARVARNGALDRLRRRGALPRGAEELLLLEPAPALPPPSALGDDVLHMVFLCCHPALAPAARVALTLKTVCGLGVSEIARALLTSEATVAQRLVRARRRIREEGLDLELPGGEALTARLEPVLEVVYLLFNEGYGATQGSELVREDLVREAERLVEGLCRRPETDRPTTRALAALIAFHAARSPARTTPDGGLLLLADQDRGRWDPERIARGFAHLVASARGERLSRYHLEAGIASCHAAAPDLASTDWRTVRDHYARLLERTASPVPRIAHAVATAQVEGAAAGLELLDGLGSPPELRGYHLLHAARAGLLVELGRRREAAAAWREALACRCSEPERRFLEGRLARCEDGP